MQVLTVPRRRSEGFTNPEEDIFVKTLASCVLIVSTVLIATACGDTTSSSASESSQSSALVGAWRSRIQFNSGAFAEVKDLEFMVVFNAGGTLTESSNYDSAPPVPPAYGVWKESGARKFEATYSFYMTKAPSTFDDIAKGGGWSPAGRGVLTEKITLSADGKSFKSTIAYAAFDQAGNSVEGGGEGTGEGVRMGF
jgi:hypothetical protein